VEDADDVSTTSDGLKTSVEVARRSWPNIPRGAAITTFAGIRAHLASHDFVLGEAEDAPLFFNAAGIESPGLTSAPAIAEDLAAEIADKLHAQRNDAYRPGRPPVRRFRHMTNEERSAAIAADPAFARIICRCETVTEAEIRDAIRRPLGARSVDAVKRRTRAGMGRCQAGFCLPRVMEILSEELGVPINDITKFGGESKFIVGELYK
jgi:glycerol-3-phosphate dehydrogenase